MDADGPGERGRRHQDPPNDELPSMPPVGAENQDFGISARLREEEEDGAVLGKVRSWTMPECGLNCRGQGMWRGGQPASVRRSGRSWFLGTQHLY